MPYKSKPNKVQAYRFNPNGTPDEIIANNPDKYKIISDTLQATGKEYGFEMLVDGVRVSVFPTIEPERSPNGSSPLEAREERSIVWGITFPLAS